MKVLLCAINAKYIHSNLAVYHLRSYAEKKLPFVRRDSLAEMQIMLEEYTINQLTENILADIYEKSPDMVAFSCYIWNWEMIQELLENLPKVLPETKLWLGGPEVSYDAEVILKKYPQVAGIMIGEGEETFSELLSCYQQGKKIQNIKGTITREKNNGMRDVLDLNELPFYYGMLSDEEIQKFKHKIVYYETSRGCPFRCSYCLSSIEKKVRLRNLELVKKELQFFLDQKVPQVKFIDRTFNCNHQHAQEIWKYLKQHDNQITNFHFEIAADILEEEDLEVIQDMRPGLIQLEIGVQTVNELTLKEINRTAILDKIRKNVAKIQEFKNIHQHLDLIAGLPYEDIESFKNSFNTVYAMRPQQLQLGFLKVLKGAEMEDKAREYGILYQTRPPYEVLSTKWLSFKEVLKLKQVEEMLELYGNSNQFIHILRALEQQFETAFDLFWEFAQFYSKKGYFTEQPSRNYRYEVIFQFACEKAPKFQEIWRELLLFDLYLREKIKSRPSFAEKTEDSSQKEKIKAFYKEEMEHPCFLKSYAEQGFQAKQVSNMTHIEGFKYPVWEEKIDLEQMYIRSKEQKTYILFDYQKRNPLTYEAEYYKAF